MAILPAVLEPTTSPKKCKIFEIGIQWLNRSVRRTVRQTKNDQKVILEKKSIWAGSRQTRSWSQSDSDWHVCAAKFKSRWKKRCFLEWHLWLFFVCKVPVIFSVRLSNESEDRTMADISQNEVLVYQCTELFRREKAYWRRLAIQRVQISLPQLVAKEQSLFLGNQSKIITEIWFLFLKNFEE